MEMSDLANVDLQPSIKWDIDSNNFPRKCREETMVSRLWVSGCDFEVLVRFLGVLFAIFYFFSNNPD